MIIFLNVCLYAREFRPSQPLHYSFSRWWFAGGELGSCLRLGDILEGEADKFLEARRMPVMLVGGRLALGGLPLPGKAPERVRAGFCTAMIWPPLADRTCSQQIELKPNLWPRDLHSWEWVGGRQRESWRWSRTSERSRRQCLVCRGLSRWTSWSCTWERRSQLIPVSIILICIERLTTWVWPPTSSFLFRIKIWFKFIFKWGASCTDGQLEGRERGLFRSGLLTVTAFIQVVRGNLERIREALTQTSPTTKQTLLGPLGSALFQLDSKFRRWRVFAVLVSGFV